MTTVREQFRAVPMAANASYEIAGSMMGGFLCVTSGTLTITMKTTIGGTLVIVNAVPVTAGIYTPLPFLFSTSQGATVALAGGASGTLAV